MAGNIRSPAHWVMALKQNLKFALNPTGCLVGLGDSASLRGSQ